MSFLDGLRAMVRGALARKVYGRLSHQNRNRVHALLNKRYYVLDLPGVLRSRAVIKNYRRDLASVRARTPVPENAGFLNFVYGFKDRDDLPLYAYLAIQSARFHNPGWPVVFSYVNEPTGHLWEKLRAEIVCVQLPQFDYFAGSKFVHYAHKADVIRLIALQELGGVYLDIDTLTVRSFAPLVAHEYGMAVQAEVHNSAAGLCNAIMWGRRNSRWVRLWLAEYRSFRSRGRDGQWDYHSVRLPAIMLQKHGQLLHILNHRAFFSPLWPEVERVMFSEGGICHLPDMEPAFGFHLWNNAIEKRLRAVDVDWIKSSTSLYAHYARPVIERFP